MSAMLTTQPAVAKALGIVRAPVPTIRLNIYTSPTWRRHEWDERYKDMFKCNMTLGYTISFSVAF